MTNADHHGSQQSTISRDAQFGQMIEQRRARGFDLVVVGFMHGAHGALRATGARVIIGLDARFPARLLKGA